MAHNIENNTSLRHGFIPEYLVRPTQRQIDELPFVDRDTDRLTEPASDIRQLGKLTLVGSGIIIAGSALAEALTTMDILNTGLAFGIGGSILGAAISVMD